MNQKNTTDTTVNDQLLDVAEKLTDMSDAMKDVTEEVKADLGEAKMKFDKVKTVGGGQSVVDVVTPTVPAM